MVNYIILLPLLVSFLVTILFIPSWIRRALQEGLSGKDIQKKENVQVAESGGLMVVLGFILGVLIYIALRTFYLGTYDKSTEIFALLTVILISFTIGFSDDILGWKRGLGKRVRILIVLFAAIPLVVINAGKSTISIPFMGSLDLGLIYPLILIPIGILGATTTFNFLAGFNGLEAGQGILILSALSIVSFFTGNSWLAIIGLCMVVSLCAFLIFNFYPAKIFPGDSLTYSVGALIAIMAIFGNFEKVAVFFFIPNIIEVFIKARGKFIKQSFGKIKEDGSLDLMYDKVYSLTHLSILILKKMKVKPTEKRVVYLIWAFQLLIIILGFVLFRKGIFL